MLPEEIPLETCQVQVYVSYQQIREDVNNTFGTYFIRVDPFDKPPYPPAVLKSNAASLQPFSVIVLVAIAPFLFLF